MIARIWQARIDPRRGVDYDRFAHERSLPTFQAHHGFLGCAFLGDGEQRTVLTLWAAEADIEALEQSERYLDTVAAISDSGFVLSTAAAITAPVTRQP